MVRAVTLLFGAILLTSALSLQNLYSIQLIADNAGANFDSNCVCPKLTNLQFDSDGNLTSARKICTISGKSYEAYFAYLDNSITSTVNGVTSDYIVGTKRWYEAADGKDYFFLVYGDYVALLSVREMQGYEITNAFIYLTLITGEGHWTNAFTKTKHFGCNL